MPLRAWPLIVGLCLSSIAWPPAGAAPSGAGAAGVAPEAVRLPDRLDLKKEIERLVRVRGYRKAVVLAAVGSLRKAVIRFAEHKDGATVDAVSEVVALTGTVTDGVAHLHLAVAPADGKVVGGHLLEGTIVNTLEVVIAPARE